MNFANILQVCDKYNTHKDVLNLSKLKNIKLNNTAICGSYPASTKKI